jgi:hypothetical protein
MVTEQQAHTTMHAIVDAFKARREFLAALNRLQAVRNLIEIQSIERRELNERPAPPAVRR